jgi:hypothetical protein
MGLLGQGSASTACMEQVAPEGGEMHKNRHRCRHSSPGFYMSLVVRHSSHSVSLFSSRLWPSSFVSEHNL